jgi:hypothetical protein
MMRVRFMARVMCRNRAKTTTVRVLLKLALGLVNIMLKGWCFG